MHDRKTAIAILKKARDILTDRLTERIIESKSEILEDANGESYESEIKSLHGQIGERLILVSQIIGSIPVPVEQDTKKPPQPVKPSAPPTFKDAAIQIQQGDLEGGSYKLAPLLGIDQHRALQCANVFYKKMKSDPEIFLKTAKIREELIADNNNSAMMLLHECFGLQGVESIGVIQTLRTNLIEGGK